MNLNTKQINKSNSSLTGGNSLTSIMVMTSSPLPCCSVGAVVSVTTMVSRTTAKKSRSNGPLTVTLPKRSTANRFLNAALSVTSLPFLLTAVIGSNASNANASLDSMSGSWACNWKILVPTRASSRTSARWVAGMKYGSLSLLFIMLTESVVVAERLGMPAIQTISIENWTDGCGIFVFVFHFTQIGCNQFDSIIVPFIEIQFTGNRHDARFVVDYKIIETALLYAVPERGGKYAMLVCQFWNVCGRATAGGVHNINEPTER